jgi:hypothetical protein
VLQVAYREAGAVSASKTSSALRSDTMQQTDSRSFPFFALSSCLDRIVSLLPYLVLVGQSSLPEIDKLKIGSQTMLYRVNKIDKNRDGNRAENQG